MFAIVKTGGQQFKVEADQKIRVQKLDAEVGTEVVLEDVLLLSDGAKVTHGTPLVDKAGVVAVVESQERDKKVIIFKRKRRQQYRRKNGHRQHRTVLKITGFVVDGKKTAVKAAPKVKPEATLSKDVADKSVAPKETVKKEIPKETAPKASAATKKTAVKKTTDKK